jgi:hypothetical protein
MLVVLLPQDRRTISIWSEHKTSTITLLKKCIASQPHTIGINTCKQVTLLFMKSRKTTDLYYIVMWLALYLRQNASQTKIDFFSLNHKSGESFLTPLYTEHEDYIDYKMLITITIADYVSSALKVSDLWDSLITTIISVSLHPIQQSCLNLFCYTLSDSYGWEGICSKVIS